MFDCGELLSADHANAGRDDRWARRAQGESLLSHAAELGHAEAQYEMGRQAENRKDYEEAFRWYLKSATQGYPDATSSVAFGYWDGRGTEQDDQKARYWMTEAADAGEPLAAESLGDMYRSSRMPIVAYRWYRVAECYGNRPGSKMVPVRQKLTPEQIE